MYSKVRNYASIGKNVITLCSKLSHTLTNDHKNVEKIDEVQSVYFKLALWNNLESQVDFKVFSTKVWNLSEAHKFISSHWELINLWASPKRGISKKIFDPVCSFWKKGAVMNCHTIPLSSLFQTKARKAMHVKLISSKNVSFKCKHSICSFQFGSHWLINFTSKQYA